MADKHPSAEKDRSGQSSAGNLGQKEAAREEISDEKMSHMDKGAGTSPTKQTEKKPQRKTG